MDRKYFACQRSGCTLRISGSETEVLGAARDHTIKVHGVKNSRELDDEILGNIGEVEGALEHTDGYQGRLFQEARGTHRN